MKVEMLRDYYGNRKGAIVDLGGVAETLIRRGFAKAVSTPKRSPQARKPKRKTSNGT